MTPNSAPLEVTWNDSLIRLQPRVDLVASTVQFNFSTPDGLTAGGGWLYDVMSGPGFTFQSSACWGKLIFSRAKSNC